jgi:hypothetical protein
MNSCFSLTHHVLRLAAMVDSNFLPSHALPLRRFLLADLKYIFSGREQHVRPEYRPEYIYSSVQQQNTSSIEQNTSLLSSK